MEEKKALEEKETDVSVEMLVEEISKLKGNSIDMEKYEKLVETNRVLVKELATNRTSVKKEPEKVAREEVIKRCQERVNALGTKDTYSTVKDLCENYRDMEELGLDTDYVDEETVKFLENLVDEAKGDNNMFVNLLDTRIKRSIR